ncbi:MAG TPA: hypothetical protein VE843_07905, partial [Ktedonobacteraceae bacterium]|nr:hypothetical protein [Ktedonobacteraceae bacterium]
MQDIRTIVPYIIIRFTYIGNISLANLFRYIVSFYAAIIMIGIIKQRKKVVPKLGVHYFSHSR